jgi:hypothetical protein
MRKLLNPKNALYLVCHALVMVLGFLACQAASNSVWFAIGGSLIAAGVAGWVIFAYVLISEETSERLRVISKLGIETAFEARSTRIMQEYVKRLGAARERIDIIGFGLSAFREDFLEDFPQWIRRAEVRILLIDPEFPSVGLSYAAQRDREEKNPVNGIAADVRKFVEEVSGLMGSNETHSLQVRLYRCLPTLNVLRIDDELFWGPYLVGVQSRNSPTFLVNRGGILFDRFSRQFETIWSDPDLSRAVPSAWLVKTR